jgi:hypothetical protein
MSPFKPSCRPNGYWDYFGIRSIWGILKQVQDDAPGSFFLIPFSSFP